MGKILGIDLGTNSIGWAIRDTGLTGNQIEKVGVLTFKKGVGDGEYSLAAERTKKRSVRRLYQARKYRLWAVLEDLILEGYCPLSMDALNRWRHYNKEEARANHNGGRIYPSDHAAFEAWIKLDFDKDGRPDYTSPYQLRKELAESALDMSSEQNRFKLGRALYHIAQRRGFKSSRKISEESDEKEQVSDTGDDLELQVSEKKKTNNLKQRFPDFDKSATIGVFLANKEREGFRVRLDITKDVVRENYKEEIKYIFHRQNMGLEHPLYLKLVESRKNKSDGSIFYRRPLRTQKGSIGKCTLEPSKYRIPVSHPAFEAFRAWAFINNIMYKEADEWKKLPLDLKREIHDKLFFRKSKSYFPFSEIQELVQSKGISAPLNYKSRTSVSGCPVSARLKDIFGNDFMNVRIPKAAAPGSSKNYYDLDDIWHVLFTFEDQECVAEYASEKLSLSPTQTKQFLIAWNALPIGYGMLSLNAIKKINRFLQKGLIYTEAVLIAKVPEIIGEDVWKQHESLFIDSTKDVIDRNRLDRQILQIVNGLISKHKNLDHDEKFGGNNYRLAESDFKDIKTAILEFFGSSKWNSLSIRQRNEVTSIIGDCYQAYFNQTGFTRRDVGGERYLEVRSNGKIFLKSDSGYYRSPKLIDSIVEFLNAHFDLKNKSFDKLYHPSELSIYQPARIDEHGELKLGSPKTGSFKNPMAMRTLHELRKLVNHLIESKQIDTETRVVVEVARELNDANRRWAIEAWQRQREAENKEFESAIRQHLTLPTDKRLNDDDIDKIRIFYEQHTEHQLPPVADKKKESRKPAKDELIRWSGHGKKLMEKYRLWKEQGYQCMYTGRYITLSDLFDGNKVDFEHTIPRSQSFDSSLANLTVCYHDYNRTIKKNQIPVNLPNYDQDFDFGGSIGKCTAILPRLDHWKDKVERIKQQVDFWSAKSKRATQKKWKDDAIQQRHLWRMELDYWQDKLSRFTIAEVTSGFKNSQKVDTQLISKYAFHYLKTYFEKVDVQKGSITAEFRKIYQLQPPDEQKDRSKHSHHAKDAAVLTLIPIAAKRDLILEKYYHSRESKIKFTETEPYKGFRREHVWSIDDDILINNITRNQELTPAKRKVRKRGKEVFIPGTTKNKWATGDSIRGQLHKETFYGAIRPARKGDHGHLLKDEDGKFIQEDEVRYVVREPFHYKKTGGPTGFKDIDEIKARIVDEGLKIQIEEQVRSAGGLQEAFERGIYQLDINGNPHGNRIRHIRVWASVAEPIPVKRQTYLSSKEYKQTYWAANATNSFFAIYRNEDKKHFEFRTLFKTARLTTKIPVETPADLFEKSIKKGKGEFRLAYVLRAGARVVFLRSRDEDARLMDNQELSKRLYILKNFEKDGRMNFRHHLEARDEKEIKEVYKDSAVNFESPTPTLRLTVNKANFCVEGYEFEMRFDGTIKWR